MTVIHDIHGCVNVRFRLSVFVFQLVLWSEICLELDPKRRLCWKTEKSEKKEKEKTHRAGDKRAYDIHAPYSRAKHEAASTMLSMLWYGVAVALFGVAVLGTTKVSGT